MNRPIALVALLLASCGDDDAMRSRDAGTTEDARAIDASMAELEWPELSVGMTADPDDPTRIGVDAELADLSCLGVWSPPEPGPPTSFDAVFWRGFDEPAPDVCFRVDTNDTLLDDDRSCADGDPRTDAMGRTTLVFPGDREISLRIFRKEAPLSQDSLLPQLLPGVRPSRIAFPGQSPSGFFVVPVLSRMNLSALPLFVDHEVVRDTGGMLVWVRDCRSRGIYGARARVARLDGTYVETSERRDGSWIFYLGASGMPRRDQPWTHVFGAFGVMNVQIGESERVLLEAWGRPAGESAARVIACREIELDADSTTVVLHLDPLYADAPRCPGLR